MKYLILTAIILTSAISNFAFGAKVAIIGFKDSDPKTEFISNAFKQYLKQNMEDAGFEILEDKSEGLNYSLLKHKNFYLASKEFFDEYENLELDYSINGSFSYRGKSVILDIEVYSREKKRLVVKGELKGNKKALLVFFQEAAGSIIRSMGSDYSVKNIFPVDDEVYFYPYIKYSYEAEKLFENDSPDKYYSLLDDLDGLRDKFDEYPVFAELYDDLSGQSEDYERPGPFNKPYANVSKPENPEDNSIQKFARELIVNGYIISFMKLSQIPVEDEPELVNLSMDFEVRLKKSYRKNLTSEIKRRQGNPHFADMGRYFFSKSNSESEEFRDFILKQVVVLRLFDEADVLIEELEKEVHNSNYSSGEYRHAKSLPLPLTPRGPANAAFGVDNVCGLRFLFEDMKISDVKRIARTEIEIVFD